MIREQIEEKIKFLEAEYQKGIAVVEDTKQKMLRIEGAIYQLKELLREVAVVGTESSHDS